MKRTNIKFLTIALLVSFVTALSSCDKDEPISGNENEQPKGEDIVIADNGSGIGTTTWKAENTYILDGFCFVNDGQVLTIEPGTVIKGKSGQGESASALIVARGGKIIAEGTIEKPIIFTAEADDLKGSVPDTARGLWGGLIILGKAKLNTIPAEQQIEGIPTSEARGAFGGNNDDDNSGIIKYVSIRHGGTDIGAGNEINGLSLGAVGSKTVIDYVEIVANADDGIEFFGGTAQVKHALVVNCGDDSFDYDMGFRGKGQFWVSLQADDSDRNGEHDGGTDPETGTPYAIPTIFNATYIGQNQGKIITFRDNAGGYYYNSIFVNHEKGIDIEFLTEGADSYKQFQNGNLKIEDNVFYNIAGQTDTSNPNKFLYAGKDGGDTQNTVLATYFTQHNIVANPKVSKTNPVPANVQNANHEYTDSWFDSVDYAGAFGTENWAKGWTLTFKN
jgi:hypothetical protein